MSADRAAEIEARVDALTEAKSAFHIGIDPNDWDVCQPLYAKLQAAEGAIIANAPADLRWLLDERKRLISEAKLAQPFVEGGSEFAATELLNTALSPSWERRP